ncbi:hypothetical protein UlMin_020057 [Ulmus minor]
MEGRDLEIGQDSGTKLEISIHRAYPEPANDDQIFLKEIKEAVKYLGGENKESVQQITKIQRVSLLMLREEKYSDYFVPREMPIGPIHADSEKVEVKQLKLKLAAKFIMSSGQTHEYLLQVVKDVVPTLKICFDANVIKLFDDEQLARMLFLDGCSVLQFIHSYVRNELKELQIKNTQVVSIQDDLFLLENQIPFEVLDHLMDSMSEGAVNKDALEQSLHQFVGMNLLAPQESSIDNKKAPLHLLDLLQQKLLHNSKSNGDYKTHNRQFNKVSKRSFPNIQNLRAAGIKLQSSGSSCLRDVTFTCIGWFRGRLKLPQLIVDDSTERKLWNLVAYEMCPDNHNSEYGVTSYLSFLDSLIDNEEDVSQLRSAQILRNRLGSDAQVLKLFDEMSYTFVSDHVYQHVGDAIQKYYDKIRSTGTMNLRIQIAQIYRGLVNHGWISVALQLSIILLILTAIQTWFTIYPR